MSSMHRQSPRNQPLSSRPTEPRPPEMREVPKAAPYRLMPELEADEAERRHAAFCEEFQSYSPLGQVMARLAATMSVRAERCVDHENAVLVDRARKAQAEFKAPAGLDAAGVAKLRREAEIRAMFDPSAEAAAARRHEAAAVRTFLRAVKELQRMKREAEARAKVEFQSGSLGSFLPGEMDDDDFEQMYARVMAEAPRPPALRSDRAEASPLGAVVELPFAIGKPR